MGHAAENSHPSDAGEFARFALRRIAAKGRGEAGNCGFPSHGEFARSALTENLQLRNAAVNLLASLRGE